MISCAKGGLKLNQCLVRLKILGATDATKSQLYLKTAIHCFLVIMLYNNIYMRQSLIGKSKYFDIYLVTSMNYPLVTSIRRNEESPSRQNTDFGVLKDWHLCRYVLLKAILYLTRCTNIKMRWQKGNRYRVQNHKEWPPCNFTLEKKPPIRKYLFEELGWYICRRQNRDGSYDSIPDAVVERVASDLQRAIDAACPRGARVHGRPKRS